MSAVPSQNLVFIRNKKEGLHQPSQTFFYFCSLQICYLKKTLQKYIFHEEVNAEIFKENYC